MTRTFQYKGYGRIYVTTADHIELVHLILKEIDEYEYNYLTDGLVTTFDMYPHVVYTGKYNVVDLDQVTANCFAHGIPVWCYNAGHQEYPETLLALPKDA